MSIIGVFNIALIVMLVLCIFKISIENKCDTSEGVGDAGMYIMLSAIAAAAIVGIAQLATEVFK